MTITKRIEYVRRSAIHIVRTIAVMLLTGTAGAPAHGDIVPREGKLEQPLIRHMATMDAATPMSVVIVLNRQVSEQDKRVLFQSRVQTSQTNRSQIMNSQRQALTQMLKEVAQQTQEPLLTFLRPLQTNGVVREVHSMWLWNVISVQAPKAIIQKLASFNEVAYIHLDLPERAIQTGPTIAWGVTNIKADKVTVQVNQTVVVGVLDTGVNARHSDLLANMWQNPGETGVAAGNNKATNGLDDDSNGFVDDVVGWNFSGTGNNNPTDTNGHGTHVAGIIAGNGAGGIRTGVAPQAKIMSLRESDTGDKNNENEVWRAMQYAAANKALIVNYSSAFPDNPLRPPDYTAWRICVQNLTDLGLLFVTAAGDFGASTALPAPTNVGTPGRVPAALTVGAFDQDTNIRSSSSQGPVTWENNPDFHDYPDPPGLNKPDLVAPGEQIQSLDFQGGYTFKSGTSMAAPHVAGVAALLLMQNPSLSPYDVRFILEETAPKRRPDTTFGWGRVNAKKAVDYLKSSLDLSPFDLIVTNIRANPRKPKANEPALFKARVKNLGGQVVGNAELRFYFADAPNRTVAQLDPNGDGTPDETNFTYIGSYFVPIVGPKGSKHESFEGVVRWTIPGPRQDHWWIGVWALPGATSVPEATPLNNGGVVRLQ